MHPTCNGLDLPYSSLFTIENEVDTDTLDNSEAGGVRSVGVGRFKLSVSTSKPRDLSLFKLILSDYDLSLVCTSKCDDEYLLCITTCGSSECFLDCSRANGACSDCEYLFQFFW